MVVLNIGSDTQVYAVKGNRLAIDLRVVSLSLAGISRVFQDNTVGSDHYPIFISTGADTERTQIKTEGKWKFEKAK